MAFRKQVGRVAIDSGMVVVGDPVYLADDPDRPSFVPKLTFDQLNEEAFGDSLDRQGADEVIDEGVVACRTGFGDGVYPVFVEYDPETNRPAKLIVEFI
jgi:hypothetical protein